MSVTLHPNHSPNIAAEFTDRRSSLADAGPLLQRIQQLLLGRFLIRVALLGIVTLTHNSQAEEIKDGMLDKFFQRI